MHRSQHLKSVKKTLKALTYLNLKADVTVTELATWIDVPRTTAHRILETLAAEGFVASDSAPKRIRYRLTEQVLSLASGFDREQGITRVATTIITTLRDEIGWSLTLSTVVGDKVLVRFTTDRDTPMSIIRTHTGARAPLLLTAGGQVYLAFCDKSERDLIIDLAAASDDPAQELARHPTQLRALLTRIRSDGYRILDNIQYPESGLAVPVFVRKQIVAGLVMRYVKTALHRRVLLTRYLPRLQRAAADITAAYEKLPLV